MCSTSFCFPLAPSAASLKDVGAHTDFQRRRAFLSLSSLASLNRFDFEWFQDRQITCKADCNP